MTTDPDSAAGSFALTYLHNARDQTDAYPPAGEATGRPGDAREHPPPAPARPHPRPPANAKATRGASVDGAALLDELHALLTRYVALPSPAAADAITLWIAASHGQVAFEHAPRLAAISPEKRCGKSRLMDIVAETCHRPLITVNATIAAVVRAVGDDPPTLLVDEADTIFGNRKSAEQNEDLRGLLNAGHQRNRPMLRCVGPNLTPTEFPTFAMAMLAGIGDLPDTIMDRAIVVRMRRRAPTETVAPYRSRRDAPPLATLRDRLAGWIRDRLDALAKAEPVMPLEDRAADTWEPLIAVADLAGGAWPERAREAAAALVAGEADTDAETSLGARLLVDLREVFGDADRLATETILQRLTGLDDAPWSDLFGKPLDSRGLARRLLPYQVSPRQVRVGDRTMKGYQRADLHDVWARYLPPERNERNEGNIAGQSVSDDPVFRMQGKHDPERNALTSDVSDVTDVSVPPDASGPCVRGCGRMTTRYGAGANPVCDTCRRAS